MGTNSIIEKEVKEQVDEAVANKGAASEALQELLKNMTAMSKLNDNKRR